MNKETKLTVITSKQILDDSWDFNDELVYVAYELLMRNFGEYMKGLEDYPEFGDTTLYKPTKDNLYKNFYHYLNNTLDKLNLDKSHIKNRSQYHNEYKNYIHEGCNIRVYQWDKGKVYTPEHEEQLAKEKKWKEEHEARKIAEAKERQRLMRIKEQAEEEAYERLREEQQEQEHEIQSMFVHPRFNK